MHGFDHTHRRRRFFVLITRFSRTNSRCGGRAPAMFLALSPIIAAMRSLKSSVVSTARFIAAFTYSPPLTRVRQRFSRSADRREADPRRACSLRRQRHLELDLGELVGRFADLAQER